MTWDPCWQLEGVNITWRCVVGRDGNGAGIPRPRRGPAPKREKFPAPVGERGGGGEENPPRNGGGGGGGGIFPRPRPAPLPSLVEVGKIEFTNEKNKVCWSWLKLIKVRKSQLKFFKE